MNAHGQRIEISRNSSRATRAGGWSAKRWGEGTCAREGAGLGLFCCLLGDESGGNCWGASGALRGVGITGLGCCQVLAWRGNIDSDLFPPSPLPPSPPLPTPPSYLTWFTRRRSCGCGETVTVAGRGLRSNLGRRETRVKITAV